MNTASNHNILILGAGFAGLAASKELEGYGQVTVIDPRDSFEFAPNIHELVSGFKSPADVKLGLREIFEDREQSFIQEKAIELDRSKKVVTTESGTQHPYDYLIIAMGGVNHDRGVAGVAEHAFPFKTAADCHAIGQRLEALESKASPYSITIVGGGVEGVEALGEILRTYGDSSHISIRLVEGGEQLLPGRSKQVHQSILETCADYPVSFHFETLVQEVKADEVILSNTKVLPSDLTIWTGGVKGHPQLEAWGLAEASGWASVNFNLQSKLDSDILIAGDAIEVIGGGEKQAYYALEMGQVAGQNVQYLAKGRRRLKAYQPKELPSVYSFGNLNCFVVYGDFVLSGLPFAGLKEAIYQLNMTSLQGLSSPEQLSATLGRGLKGSITALHSLLNSPRPSLSKLSIGLVTPFGRVI